MKTQFLSGYILPNALSILTATRPDRQPAFQGGSRFIEQGQKGAITAVVATLRGGLREVDPGEWSGGSKAEFKYAVDVTYYKLEIDGRVMFEIDPINCVRVIDGVDQLADVRNALGL